MSRRTRRSGSAFIYALAVVVGLIAMLTGLTVSQRGEIRRVARQSQDNRIEVLLRSGLDRALAELAVLATESPTLLSDDWALLGQEGGEPFVVGRGRFRVQILDASSHLNLNTIDEEHLQRLPLSAEQIDSLLDWREEERAPRAQGAKDEFYNQLDPPYNAALAPFETLEELNLVRGFTPRRIYEPQEDVQSTVQLVAGSTDQQPSLYDLLLPNSGGPNLGEGGQPKTNASEGQIQVDGIPPNIAQAIVAARPINSYSQMLNLPGVNLEIARAILDNLAPNGDERTEGTINVNTASEAVLNSLPDMTPDLTEAILSRQQAGITTLGELADLPGINLIVLGSLADRVRVASDTFLVRVLAEAGSARGSLEALVRVEGGIPRVLKRWTPPFRDPAARWLWGEPGAETILVEPTE